MSVCVRRWVSNMAKHSKRNPSAKWGGGGFTAIPHRVLDSPKFAALSPCATKLLIDLVAQYRGHNNGDLCAATALLKPRGWNSKSSLTKAIKELVDTGFLILTRRGGRHKPNLYALSFYAIDDCKDKQGFSKFDPDLGIKPTVSPRDDWLRGTAAPDLQAAQKRKKQADIIDLTNHLKANPDDKYADNIRRGIAELERLQN